MANRVVLGAFEGTFGLKISRPGFNVLSTGLTAEQVAFDSRWDDIGKIYNQGVSTNFQQGSAGTTNISFNIGGAFSTSDPVLLFGAIKCNSAHAYYPNGYLQVGGSPETDGTVTLQIFSTQASWYDTLTWYTIRFLR
jgi:hypothetical protein